MLTVDDLLDSFVESPGIYTSDTVGLEVGDSETISTVSWREPGYEGAVDYRIRQLSYSSLLTLHSCPREFQLYKLRTTHREEESLKSTITFNFGHVVGEGIQLIFQELPWEDILWKLFLNWEPDLLVEDEKAGKSFFSALLALKKFKFIKDEGYLNDYELVYFHGKPACELSFAINLLDGFRLRGYVDLVLRHKLTGEVVVIECKTTGAKSLDPAIYKNSAQAIGYSVVLDHIVPDVSSYKVIYLVYKSSAGEWVKFDFIKTYLMRAQWIRELLMDVECIKMYEEAQIYPMRGESCFKFFRPCQYINSCTLSTQYLTKPCTPAEEDKVEYQFNINLVDLLNTQMQKVES
jgi:PD-(D/E)XK nuclease superfamily